MWENYKFYPQLNNCIRKQYLSNNILLKFTMTHLNAHLNLLSNPLLKNFHIKKFFARFQILIKTFNGWTFFGFWLGCAQRIVTPISPKAIDTYWRRNDSMIRIIALIILFPLDNTYTGWTEKDASKLMQKEKISNNIGK